MPSLMDRLRSFLTELKRRNVYRVAATYAVVAFVGFQTAKLLIPSTVLPPWTDEFFLFLLIIGFPVALVVAWAFELTPEGVRRTEAREPAESMSSEERQAQSRLAMKALMGLGLVGAAVAGGWYLMGGGGEAESGPRAGDRSIAVLPFEALGQAEPDVFTEGMHDDLLARLSNVSDLKVISRTAVQQYRGSDKTTGEIAREVGVRWVLEGGVQEMGNEIQVNAQLIDPRTETHAWAESYRRDLTAANLFDLQSEITKQIARSLEMELSPAEEERVERRPTGDLEAYKLYVQGRRHLDTRSEEGMRQAVDYFRRAIARDSSYALAWSGLADAVGLFPVKGYASPEGPLPDHEPTARRALELDPELAEAHASMGLVHLNQQNAPAALRDLRRALELKPSYAQAHHWLGLLQYEIGRLEAAHEHVSLAVELNPRHAAAQGVLVWILVARGDLEAAEPHLRRREQFPGGLGQRVLFLYHAKRWDELEALAREQLEEGGVPWWRFYLARIAALQGDTAAARGQLAEIREVEAYGLAGLVHAALGEADAAFSAWRKVEEWGRAVMFLRYFHSDILDPLREDPRYRELIRENNQEWGLNPDGSLPDSVDVSFDAQSDD